MPTKKLSAASRNGLKKQPKHSELGKSIIQGLKELQSHMLGEIKLRTRVVYLPDEIDIQSVREKSGLSQSQFAERYGFNLRTLQEWEQGRARPYSAQCEHT